MTNFKLSQALGACFIVGFSSAVLTTQCILTTFGRLFLINILLIFEHRAFPCIIIKHYQQSFCKNSDAVVIVSSVKSCLNSTNQSYYSSIEILKYCEHKHDKGLWFSRDNILFFFKVHYHKAWYGSNRNFEVKIIFRSVMREAGRFKKWKYKTRC